MEGKVKEELRCCMCNAESRKNKPVSSLPCGHPLCLNCLKKNSPFSLCPLCKEELPKNMKSEEVRPHLSNKNPSFHGAFQFPSIYCVVHPHKHLKFTCMTCDEKIICEGKMFYF